MAGVRMMCPICPDVEADLVALTYLLVRPPPKSFRNWGIGAFLDRAEAIRALVNDDETSAIYRTASK